MSNQNQDEMDRKIIDFRKRLDIRDKDDERRLFEKMFHKAEGVVSFDVEERTDKVAIVFSMPIIEISITPEQAADFANALCQAAANVSDLSIEQLLGIDDDNN